VYKALGQLANAIIATNKALEIDDKNIEFLYQLADLQAEAGNYLAAKETIGKLFEIDAGNGAGKSLLKEISKLEMEAANPEQK
jgi:tetratricopeptide (TPR) repeat protein